jgi:hypothetical protein
MLSERRSVGYGSFAFCRRATSMPFSMAVSASLTVPAPAPVFGDPRDRGEREVAMPVAPKHPWPRPAHHPQHGDVAQVQPPPAR